MAEVIDQDGNPLIWRAVYWQFHVLDEEECGSLEEAINFLHFGEEDNRLSGEAIIGPDGRKVNASWDERVRTE
jgi:hypothetical protein